MLTFLLRSPVLRFLIVDSRAVGCVPSADSAHPIDRDLTDTDELKTLKIADEISDRTIEVPRDFEPNWQSAGDQPIGPARRLSV